MSSYNLRNDTQSNAKEFGMASAAFPAEASECAKVIRARDSWPTLGPREAWPTTLNVVITVILQSPTPMVVLWGPAGILFYNDGYAAIAGSRHPDMLGMPVREAWPEAHDFNSHVLEQCLAGGTLTYRDQHFVLQRPGRSDDAWFDLTYSPIFDAQDSPAGVLAIVNETTLHVLEERRRKRAEQRLHFALASGTLIGSWTWDIASNILVTDGRMADFFSIDPLRAAGGIPIELVVEAIHPGDRASVTALIAQAIKSGEPFHAEYRVKHIDGIYHWVEASGHCEIDSSGAPVQFPGVLLDISERKQAIAAQQQSEAQIRAILDTVPVGLMFAEAASGRITQGNARLERILGQPAPQVALDKASQQWQALYPDGQPVPSEQYPLEQALTSGQSNEGEFIYQRGDGAHAWIKALGTPVKDDYNNTIGSLLTVIDIDREKRAEARQALRLALDARLQALDDAAEMIRTASEMIARHFGGGRAGYGEIDATAMILDVGHEWTDGRMLSFAGRYRLEEFGPEVIRAFRAGQAVRIEDTLTDSRTQAEPIAAAFNAIDMRSGISVPLIKDGRWVASVYVHCQQPRQWSDADEQLLREVANRTWQAIQRAHAEDRLRQLNATLATQIAERTRERDRIWQVSHDLLGLADEHGRWRSINPAWQRLLGWSEQAILGRSAEWMTHPDDREHTHATMRQLADSQATARFENRLQRHDGSYCWLDWTIVANDGLLYGVARDISNEKAHAHERAQMQEQLRQAQKMEAVGQLTGGIAHDFNNMLTSIISGLDLLQRRSAAGQLDDLERYIGIATASARRAAALTHRLLAFSRRQTLDIRSVDINALIGSLEEMLRRTIGAHITLTTQLARPLWPALTDANQIESMLLNLCINARDAMASGGEIHITTSVVQLDAIAAHELGDLPPGAYVRIGVSDTGSGMTPEVRERAFDPFFTTKPIGQGSGLGLSMIYGFIKQSGGHVQIDSELGRGTTVQLYLPRATDPVELIEAVEPADVWPQATASECVMLVEDDASVRMVLVEVLHELGYNVIEAASAPAALSTITSAQRIDLLITDVGLPGMSGRDFAEVARQQRPSLPILFITGYAEGATTLREFLAEGMQLISKPFDINVLVTTIHSMIAHS